MDILVSSANASLMRSSSVDVHIGKLLLDAGKLNEHDIKRIVALQKTQSLRFGEAAMSLGLLEAADILRALSVQYEYPNVALGDASFKETLIAAYRPFSAQAEALRALRSQLLLRWFGGRRKLLTLTAAGAGEGCSELAANLAICFAQLGEKTLLIDADLRNSSQHDLFGLKPGAGLSNLLAGRGALYDVVNFIDAFKCLSVLCAGAAPPNPQELLGRAIFHEVLAAAKEDYDVIIIDTPPATSCADAQIVAALTEGCLLATRRHCTRMVEVEIVKNQFSAVGINILGAVINE